MPCNIINFFRAANGEYTHWGKFEKEVWNINPLYSKIKWMKGVSKQTQLSLVVSIGVNIKCINPTPKINTAATLFLWCEIDRVRRLHIFEFNSWKDFPNLLFSKEVLNTYYLNCKCNCKWIYTCNWIVIEYAVVLCKF